LGAFMFDAIGLLLGSRTEKTETASGLMNLFMLPQYLLSGVFFSSRRFPDEVQPFIQALPLTQVNDALREVMLEGARLTALARRVDDGAGADHEKAVAVAHGFFRGEPDFVGQALLEPDDVRS